MSIAPPLAEPVAKAVAPGIVETDIPARLDRLPWGRFHNLVIVALGVTWILDGLEVTLAGSLAGALEGKPDAAVHATPTSASPPRPISSARSSGALFFGWLTDRLGRKKLFFITLALYLVATAATALSWNLWSYCLFRFLTGAGIGGEYTAINSTIQELIPARVRGWTDLVINGSFWIGAAIGAAGSVVLLDPVHFGPDTGLARRLLHRRGARARDPADAHVDPGEPALAHDAWPRRRGRGDRQGHRGLLPRRGPRDRARGAAALPPSGAQPHAAEGGFPHALPRASRGAPMSASRSWPRRRSSTTRSSSPTRWS